ncbi:MAG: CHASE2 domain-containing protein [Proteobacteria bacterium]|nr:CHASE2 domain-containing protein [Pseudomonadota bacterium]
MRQTAVYFLRRFGVPATIFLMIAAIFVGRGFEVVENPLIDLRLSSQTRAANADIVVVAIDPKSLAALGAWPWPRARHAEVIDRLFARGARQVAIDIDLSSVSNPANDARLAQTLARHRDKTILAAFTQQQTLNAQPSTRLLSQPLDMFRASANVAAIVLRPDRDGRIRRMPLFEDTGRSFLATFAAALATGTDAQPSLFYIDLSFDPTTIPTLSYIDVLNGTVPDDLVRDRKVVIGVTSSQLGTHVPVPRFRALPATIVHVLATQSLQNNRALVRPTGFFTLAVAAILAFGLWSLTRRSRNFGQVALLCGGVAAGSIAASFATFALSPILLDTAPWILTAFLVFLASTAEQLQRQRRRIVDLAREQKTSTGFMQLVFNTIEEAILTAGPTGEIRSVNAATQKMFGHSRKALVGQDVTHLIPLPQQERTNFQSFMAQLLASTERQRHLAQRSDGTTFPVDLTARELASGQEGFVITVEDISDYVAAEIQRDTIQSQLLDAMESFGEAFAMFDANDRLIVCNSAFRRLHSQQPDICVPGTPFTQILDAAVGSGLFQIDPAEKQDWLAHRQELRAGGGENFIRTISVRDDIWLRIVDQKTSEGGFITILFDVTDAKRHELSLAQSKNEAEVANLAKSQFLANMSHELRTPLNAVIGFSEMMMHEIRGPMGNEDYAVDVRAIHESASHLLEIINDILDLSQIEAGTLVLDEQETDMAELLASVCRLLRPHATAIELKVNVSVADNLPRLWVDPRITKQLFINLLSNAIKFSPAGGTVSIDASYLPSGELEVTVTDFGIGIASEFLSVVFEPFGQVENAMTRSHDGVGLGLPLSKKFCDAMDAQLSFVSTPGQGTTVRVRFPAERVRRDCATGELHNLTPAHN